jgi:protein AbiQ
MIQLPLEVYRIDMKYIRNLHNIDDRVFSVSPQTRKDERPFLGVILVCNEHKYCVPLSKPKKKHEKMRDKIDFKKIVHNGSLIGVLNFNLAGKLAEQEPSRPMPCKRYVCDVAGFLYRFE